MLIPDNCKTAVSKNTRYETVLNKSYQELAEHYNVAVVPARVRKPDDKSAAEGSVRFVSTWITASLRDRKFFTIGEAKQAVAEKLEELNRRPFKKRPGCRLTAFEQEEKEFLKPLPLYTYEPSVWIHPKVGYDYLVNDGVNKYSVPFDLIGEKVDVRLTKHIVEVFYKQIRDGVKKSGKENTFKWGVRISRALLNAVSPEVIGQTTTPTTASAPPTTPSMVLEIS